MVVRAEVIGVTVTVAAGQNMVPIAAPAAPAAHAGPPADPGDFPLLGVATTLDAATITHYGPRSQTQTLI